MCCVACGGLRRVSVHPFPCHKDIGKKLPVDKTVLPDSGGRVCLSQCYQGGEMSMFVIKVEGGAGGEQCCQGRVAPGTTCCCVARRGVARLGCGRVGARRVLVYEIRGLFTDVNDRRACRRD